MEIEQRNEPDSQARTAGQPTDRSERHDIERHDIERELRLAREQAEEALKQQIASAEILRAISRSPADSQPVFQAIVDTGVSLFAGAAVAIGLPGPNSIQAVAVAASTPELAKAWRDRFPIPLTRDYLHGTAILDGRVVDIPDALAAPEQFAVGIRIFLQTGYRAVTIMPLMRGDQAIGTLSVVRREPGPLTLKQHTALATFTEQAVIAIENARLFNEIRESLEQQKASAEVLSVISSSIGDTTPVFDKIIDSCERLFSGRIVGLNLVGPDGLLHLGSFHGAGRDAFEKMYPMPVGRMSASGLAIGEQRVVHYPDVEHGENIPQVTRDGCNAIGIKSVIFAPVMWEGRAIGAIFVGRERAEPFSDKEIALLKTFADQAAIGIENARLFRELERRNRDVSQALEQQTATAEILKVISKSPTDVAPVFETILANAVRICNSRLTAIFRYDGSLLHLVATRDWPEQALAEVGQRYPMIPDRTQISGRAILAKSVVHVADTLADPHYDHSAARVGGWRRMLGVPLMREGEPIGSLVVAWPDPGEVAPEHICLLETFADQAVIAIENVRLFNETKEALERQTATAEILGVISSSPTSTDPVFAAILSSSARLCEADMGLVLRYDNGRYTTVATLVPDPAFDHYLHQPIEAGPLTGLGRVAATKAPVNIPDLVDDEAYRVRDPLRMRSVELGGVRSWLGVPMLREGELIGAICIYRKEVRPFNERQAEVLRTFTDQAVIAIENVRLFQELQSRNRDLTEALEQQIATAEILRVISSSPSDLRPVFAAVAQNAARLCEAPDVVIIMVEGDVMRHAASVGAFGRSIGTELAIPVSRHSVSGRAVVERATVHVHDLAAEPDDEYPIGKELQRRYGQRTMVAVPLMRAATALGVIVVLRQEVRPFTDKQMNLLRTFADQAVIAIENVRLFNETKEALDQQRASSEVLTAISNSIADTKPVFDVILQSCQRLFSSETVGMTLVRDDGMLDIGAYTGPGEAGLRRVFPRPLDRTTSSGKAILDQRVQAYTDVDTEMPEISRAGANAMGLGSMAFAPMLHGGRAIGTLWIGRAAKTPFSDKQLALLTTFADQAVIAIQNARLFNETQEALETQTATADILKVISESPTDLQPVFDAICERARVLCNAVVTGVARYDGEWVHLVAYRGVSPEADHAMRSVFPMRAGQQSTSARAVGERVPVQIPDVLADPLYGPKDAARRAGYRANLAVPMLKEGQVVGAIVVCRAEPGIFPQKQIRVLQTFADQAVIAIENVRLFNELREQGIQLERASRHKSEFLANMSHELRTPLNAIIGFTRIVMRRSRDQLDPKQYENLEKILQSGHNLLALINSILDLAKVEAGRVEVHPGDLELVQLLDQCIRTIEPLVDESRVRIDKAYHRSAQPMFADEEKLRQIMINLLSNAAKFTPQGSIRIETSGNGNCVAIAVRDTGIGIAPDKVETIFEEFEQAGATDNLAQRGTGLGLTIARRLARLMGGDITVASTLERGSTFTLRLPLAYGSPTDE